jgi:hypothetical protein
VPPAAGGVVTVEVSVDANGRIEDYWVLSGARGTQSLSSQIKNMLILTTFRPATLMGRPTGGTATLVFSRADVTAPESSQQQ